MDRTEALERSDELLSELAEALKAGRSMELLRYLELLSKLHHYSFLNVMLIYLQQPTATNVAGFNRWKKLGRYVKKGEKGISILAPMLIRKAAPIESLDEDNEKEAPKKKRRLRGFRVVSVFDVSQTEGRDLPSIGVVQGEPGEMLERLECLVRSCGIKLTYDQLPLGTLGFSVGGSVTVKAELSPAMTFSVLAHEFAHELLRHRERPKTTSKAVIETEAEAVAFVVSRGVGLEVDSRSANYVQLWGGDEETLRDSLELIRNVASLILAGLLSEVGKEAVHA